MKIHKKNHRNKSIIFAVILVLLLFITIYFIYLRAIDRNDSTAEQKTTSTAPSAQEGYSAGDSRTPASNDSEKGSAAIADNQGQQTITIDQSQWITSKTGEITVYQPAKDQFITKNSVISGASTLNTVNYRVIDNISGMIAQGQLSVVNGKFSGTINFNTTASYGRIDLYGAEDSGKEFGNIEVPIRFK